jgi:hypothetical protein
LHEGGRASQATVNAQHVNFLTGVLAGNHNHIHDLCSYPSEHGQHNVVTGSRQREPD